MRRHTKQRFTQQKKLSLKSDRQVFRPPIAKVRDHRDAPSAHLMRIAAEIKRTQREDLAKTGAGGFVVFWSAERRKEWSPEKFEQELEQFVRKICRACLKPAHGNLIR